MRHANNNRNKIANNMSPLLGAYNSRNKPMQRHFYRPVYF